MSIREIINRMLATVGMGEARSILSKIGSIRDGRQRAKLENKRSM